MYQTLFYWNLKEIIPLTFCSFLFFYLTGSINFSGDNNSLAPPSPNFKNRSSSSASYNEDMDNAVSRFFNTSTTVCYILVYTGSAILFLLLLLLLGLVLFLFPWATTTFQTITTDSFQCVYDFNSIVHVVVTDNH